MSNRIIFVLVGAIALAILADLTLNGGSALLFLARKMMDLIALVTFWR